MATARTLTRYAIAAMALGALGGSLAAARDAQTPKPPTQTIWPIDRLDRIGGHPVELIGAPRVVETSAGPAVEFDGARDGLIVAANPIAGLRAFTIEALIEPAPDGQEEQRFLHIQESDTENRALLEIRVLPGAGWVLDSYLRHGDTGLTLIDRGRVHPASRWYAVALTFDGKTMTHYVNGGTQGSGFVTFPAMAPGRTSIGVRQNLVSHFKGRIRLVRFTTRALAPDSLLEAR
jgi:hypothetical protein